MLDFGASQTRQSAALHVESSYISKRVAIVCLYKDQCPAGGVFQYQVGSGLGKIPGSRSGSGRVEMSKYTIGYFRVSFLLSGISGHVGYFRVFLGLPIYTRVIF